MKPSRKESQELSQDAIEKRIDTIVQAVASTPLGKPLVQFGIMKDVQVYLTDEIQTPALYKETSLGGAEIYLNVKYANEVLMASLAHELRHVEQSILLQKNILMFSLEDAIILNRLLEADASAFSIGVIHQLSQQTGNKKLMRAFNVHGEQDIRDRFLSSITAGIPLDQDVKPFQEAFKQWYLGKNRVDGYAWFMEAQFKRVGENVIVALFGGAPHKLTKRTLKSIGDLSKGFNYLAGKDAPNPLKAPYTEKKPYAPKARKGLMKPQSI